MRKVFSVALMAAMLCLVGMTRDANATITFDLIWTTTTGTGIAGTNSIFADAGDTLTLSIRMTTTQTMDLHAFSLNFDTDLGNELNLVGAAEWGGTSFGTSVMASGYLPLTLGTATTVESTAGIGGRINTYESGIVTGTGHLPTGVYVIGTARFTVTSNVATDGNDVFSGLFNTLVDGIVNNANEVIPTGDPSVVFNGAAVNVIPEPGTVSLLGLGLVGLVLAGRRSRRS